ncbi:MAG: redoxin family protein [Lentisphaerae bacterium]|nr:redoxin family protein [Lentisphaerota bacterium]MBT4823303.1 redoxin family protein [Lentisphaerota bacterium]MBT5609825.1 redoxin family protein [Lentisphaerota bacterium]MBT7055143.1 redoxin family protein [Lentisphaerota bacterium]MBT7846315.1 redoxin family protein [Lentisphaerota bacterium]
MRRFVTLAVALVVSLAVTGCRRAEKPAPAAQHPKVGQPFPYTRFVNGKGQVVDLATWTGKKNVLLVFMRGFPGYVCPTCTRHTAQLIERADELKERNAEVLLVYPGPTESIPQFVTSVSDLLKGSLTGELPVPILLDVDLAAVKAVGIESDLAWPASFIIGVDGLVKYGYIGKNYADRPTVDDVLGALDSLSQP